MGRPAKKGKGMTMMQAKFFDGLDKGKSKKEAFIDAGYSVTDGQDANRKAWKLVKDWGDYWKYEMEKQGVSLGNLSLRLKDGLDAWERKGKSESFDPDFKTRLQYIDKIMEITGTKPKEAIDVHFGRLSVSEFLDMEAENEKNQDGPDESGSKERST